ncbi:MAG: hypothetical protein RL154_157 [Pseudomonadota bacterium]
MKIAKDCVVTINYSVVDIDGNIVDDSPEPIVYLHGGHDLSVFPKIAAALANQEVGFKTKVELEPEEAFGDYDDDLIEVEAREAFPKDLELGSYFTQEDSESGEELPYVVTEITDDSVVLDGNHPLAGVTLIFDCEVVSVRKATKEEIKNKMPIF